MWINKHSSPNKEIFLLVKGFWEFSIDHKFQVIASHIKSGCNKVIDFESRKIRENLEWSIQGCIFLKMLTFFKCNFTTELFASRVNAKVDRFYAFYVQPDSEGTDPFS